METKEKTLDACELFAKMSADIDRAETWYALQEIFSSMDITCSASIIDADFLIDILREDCDGLEYNTLEEWRLLAESILAIPQSRGYYLWNGWLNFKALTDEDFDEVKELCRREARDFTNWFCENAHEISREPDK